MVSTLRATRWVQAGVLAVTIAGVRDASAAPRPAQLTYAVAPGIAGCPDEKWVRHSVAARLGFEPFSADGSLRIDATIARASKGLRGELRVVEGGGAKRTRQLSSQTGDCLELASAMELAIAIVIDPQYLLRPAPPVVANAAEPDAAPPAFTSATAVPAPYPGPSPTAETAPVTARADEVPHAAVSARAGAHLAAGLSPVAVLGAFGGASFRWTSWSLALEARADLPGSIAFGGGRVEGSVLLGSAAVCGHVNGWALCGFGSAGALQVTGVLSSVTRSSSPLLLAGFRGEVDVYRRERFAVRPFLEIQAVLTRTTVSAAEQTVWVTGPLAGRLGIVTEFELLR